MNSVRADRHLRARWRGRCRRRWTRSARGARGESADAAPSTAIAGPRSEPPMPMLITVVKRAARAAIDASRTSSANYSMRSRSASTWRAMSAPPGAFGETAGTRNAACRTARPSVMLIGSPRHIASMRARRPLASARLRAGAGRRRRCVDARSRDTGRRPRVQTAAARRIGVAQRAQGDGAGFGGARLQCAPGGGRIVDGHGG